MRLHKSATQIYINWLCLSHRHVNVPTYQLINNCGHSYDAHQWTWQEMLRSDIQLYHNNPNTCAAATEMPETKHTDLAPSIHAIYLFDYSIPFFIHSLYFFFSSIFRKCPQTLVAPIVKLALEQTHQTLRKAPEQYGFVAKINGKYGTL